MDFVDEILEADKSVRRKQRHTAPKIWDRIMKEKNVSLCESVVRAFVRKRKQEMGLKGQTVTIPQIYSPGQEAQIDWFEADVKFHGVVTTIQFFCMRSMYSGGAFHRAYLSSTQQAFLDAHEHGFRHFGGFFSGNSGMTISAAP
jgi:transposase